MLLGWQMKSNPWTKPLTITCPEGELIRLTKRRQESTDLYMSSEEGRLSRMSAAFKNLDL